MNEWSNVREEKLIVPMRLNDSPKVGVPSTSLKVIKSSL